MKDEKVLGIRQLPDGEELVTYVESAVPSEVGGESPLVASAERRHRALAERRQKPRNPWQPRAAAAPPPR